MVEFLMVPYLGTAEEDVLLAEWRIAEGESIHQGETVAVVETLKAAFEVEAERAGVIVRRLVEVGARVPLRAPLAVLAAPDETWSEDDVEALLREVPTEETPGEQDAPSPILAARPDAPAPAAPLARRRATELGVDLAGVRGTGPGGMVRVEDVEAAAPSGDGGADGQLDPTFVARLRAEGAAFAALSSELKVAIYRRFGARLGDDVTIDPGALLIAERLVVGEGSRFGTDTTVEAVEFVAGRLAQFGPRCRVRCRRIELGDNAFFAPDVEIGGGGAMEPEAELVVGSHGFVGEHTHLNPCRRLEIGDEVVVSRGATVMTHSFGGSVLAGYPNRFAGVRLGDGCQVGIGAMLFPGAEMGAGSVLLSNSTLVTSIPKGRMFGGVPATDMKAAGRQLTPQERSALGRSLVLEFARQLGLRGLEVTVLDDEGVEVTVTTERGTHRLHYGEHPPDDGALPREDVWVAQVIDDAAFDAAPPELAVFDLGAPRLRGPGGPLCDGFREFLRKRGVRLEPRAWTYRGGLL